LFANKAFSQVNISIGNQKTLGGDLKDNGIVIKKLNDGYVALVKSKSSISFDRTVALYGGSDYWLIGLNNNLTPIWQSAYGGNQYDEPYDMIVTENNDIIMVGTSLSPISGNKTVANIGNKDVWVICTDSIGNIKWQNTYGGIGAEYYATITQLDNGNYIIGTSSTSNISGSKTEDSRGWFDYWVFCIDNQGNVLWDKTFGGAFSDRLSRLIQISQNEIIISGLSNSLVSGEKTDGRINPDTTSIFEYFDLWLIKYDFINNQIIWDKTIGGVDDENINALLAFDTNNIYILGASLSGISGTKTTANLGGLDIWLNKLDTSGNVLLQKEYGGSGYDVPSYIASINNSIVVGATSDSPISATKTENQIGGYSTDYWLFSIDHTGNIIWDKTIGGDDAEELSSIYVEDENHYVAIGSSLSDISGYKTEALRGSNLKSDAWLVELFTSVGIKDYADSKSKFTLYPNPATENLHLELTDNIVIDKINIYNQLGEVVIQKQISSRSAQINVASLSKGVYIIEVISASGDYFKEKFVKE
jgi:hypothetical protein